VGVCRLLGVSFVVIGAQGVAICIGDTLFSLFYLCLDRVFCKYPSVGMGYDADVMKNVLCNFEFH